MKRNLLETLFEWRAKPRRKPLLLRGARQVGKSWLLKEFGKSFERSHYINFEREVDVRRAFSDSLAPDVVLKNLGLVLGEKIDVEKHLVIFDEVQECAAALTSMKYFAEECPELALCAAGSHLGVAFSDSSFPVGKVEQINLYPMNFSECLEAWNPGLLESYRGFTFNDMEHQILWKEYLKFLYVGGMPEAVLNFQEDVDDIDAVRHIQRQLLQSYLGDFSKHAGKQNASHLAAIYENIPRQLQSVYDDSVSRFKFKGVIPNRSKYAQFSGPIDWLVHTGIVLKVNNVSVPNRPLKAFYKENFFKLLYADIGLLGAALDITYEEIQSQNYGSYKGFVAENFVAQELRSCNSGLCYWKLSDSSSTAEIEFLIESEMGTIPVEVKSGVKSIKSKSLSSYINKFAPTLSIKLSGNKLRYEEKMINVPLYLAGRIEELIAEHSAN